jgi:hypothetical protein
MTKYQVCVSHGGGFYDRCYFNELGAVQLSQEMVDKYFTFDEDGEINYDSDVLNEAVDRDYDDPNKDDFPNWDTITDGCICWGPDANDQSVSIFKDDDEDNSIWTKMISELTWYSPEELEEDGEVDKPYGIIYYEKEPTQEGVWILYNSYERGSYQGEFELPDDVEFDPSKLIIRVTEVSDGWNVVSGVEYDNEDVYCEGDTIGKGIDWYVCHKGEALSFR